MIKRNRYIKTFSFFMILIMLISNLTIVANANDDDFYAQYSGSTDASWGYKPYCTFTINKIVGNRFRGTFSAQNIDPYSFTENVSGRVTSDNEGFTCDFIVNFITEGIILIYMQLSIRMKANVNVYVQDHGIWSILK